MPNKTEELQGRIEELERTAEEECGGGYDRTHFHACPCRELRFAKMEVLLAESLELLETTNPPCKGGSVHKRIREMLDAK